MKRPRAQRKMPNDDAEKKGKGYDMTQLPQITKEIISGRRERKRKDERFTGIFFGIPFASLLRLSHPAIITSIDLTIPSLCSRILVQINKAM